MDLAYTISGTTPAAPGTAAVGSPVVFGTFLDAVESLDVNAQLVGATGGVLDLYLQTSPDGGTTWFDYAHFAQLAAGAAAIKVRFGVARHGQQLTIATVGTGLTPALAVATVVGGPFGDRMRLVAVAGASTSAGAAITIQIRAQSVNRQQQP
jgi:hypothetical protein